MDFIEQLEQLEQNAIINIGKKIEKNGVESKNVSEKVLKITEDELMINLCGGRYLIEVSKYRLIDNEGYQYGFEMIDTEQLMKLATKI